MIRDPATGSSYSTPYEAFMRDWRGGILFKL
jgi:hypothetical protein